MSGVYLNDVSMERRMRDGFVFNLKQITKANGYRTNLGDILIDAPLSLSDVLSKTMPAIVMAFGEEKNVAEATDFHELVVPVNLYCHISEASRQSDAILDLKMDIQQMLGSLWMLPGADGLPTCGRAKYLASLPFSKVNDISACGVRITVEVTYQQLLGDPTQN